MKANALVMLVSGAFTLVACRGLLGVEPLELDDGEGGVDAARTTDARADAPADAKADATDAATPFAAKIAKCKAENPCRPCCKAEFRALKDYEDHARYCLCTEPYCKSACSGGSYCSSSTQPDNPCGKCIDDALIKGDCKAANDCTSAECKAAIECLQACPAP